MKTKIVFFLMLVIALFPACTEEEVPVFSGTNAIQFASNADEVLSYMFFYDDPSVQSVTINFKALTTGYTSDVDRTFKIKQLFPEGVNNAESGKDFEPFSDDQFVVKAGAVRADIPITILRSELEPKKIYQISIQIEANENFIKGDTTLLVHKLIFSPDLIQPNEWDEHAIKYTMGPYSVNKHAWMIEQTGERWDDEFIAHFYAEGIYTFWRDVLNMHLREYNATVGPLYDDDGIEITQFP
ncbi:MAG: DUF4843 domain-containing protein [Draconibacterium sp.]